MVPCAGTKAEASIGALTTAATAVATTAAATGVAAAATGAPPDLLAAA